MAPLPVHCIFSAHEVIAIFGTKDDETDKMASLAITHAGVIVIVFVRFPDCFLFISDFVAIVRLI